MTVASKTKSRNPSKKGSATQMDDSVVRSSGNVFADLNLDSPGIDEAKVEMATAINQNLAARASTQLERAELLGVDQSTMSFLENYQLARFTLDRLIRYAATLGIPWLESLVASSEAKRNDKG